SARDIVECDEVNAAMIECIIRLAEELTVERPVIESCIVLAGNVHDLRRSQPAGDRLKGLHSLRMLAGRLRFVRQVAGEEHELRLRIETVDDVDRFLERLGPRWIRRAG